MAGSEAGVGSKVRVIPVADPLMIQRTKTVKRNGILPTQVSPSTALSGALSTVPGAPGCCSQVSPIPQCPSQKWGRSRLRASWQVI